MSDSELILNERRRSSKVREDTLGLRYDQETRILTRLVEDRRTLIGDKVRLTNRITAALKSYYPQSLQWFDDIDTNLLCDFIQQ